MGDGETLVAPAICLTNLKGHPWRPEGSSRPQLTDDDDKIHSGTESLDKGKYLTRHPIKKNKGIS